MHDWEYMFYAKINDVFTELSTDDYQVVTQPLGLLIEAAKDK